MSEQKLAVFWDEENQVIRNESSGPIDAAFAQQTVDKEFELLEEHPGAGILVCGTGVTIFDQIAGAIFAQALQDPRLTKVAFLHSNEQLEQIAQYLLKKFPHLCDIKFFDDEASAIKWLNQDK